VNEFFLITLAAAVSMLIIPVAWRVAPRLGMVDMPDARKVHAAPVPRVGGWGISVGCVLPLLVIFSSEPVILSYVIGVAVLFLFGLWDDARQIGHWPKFVGQIVAVGVVVYYGDLYVARLPFLVGVVLGPALGKLFTMFALIGVINAVNHSDGLDGLAGGESILSLIAMAFLGFAVDNSLVVGIALTTIGGTIGFLRYNTYPARVFMGDCGSQVLGFTLGFVAVYLIQVANPVLSAALPLLLLGLPLADILAVLYQRIKGGMNWFRATRNHVHHRLLDLGFSHFETVVVIYSIQATLVVAAVLLRYQLDYVVTAFYFAVVVMLFGTLTIAERRGWRVRDRGVALRGVLPGPLQSLREAQWLRRLPLALVVVLVPAFMLLSAAWVATVPKDFGVIAAIMAIVLAREIWRRSAAASALVRGSIYVTAAFTVYLFTRFPNSYAMWVGHLVGPTMILLALAVAIFIRFYSERRFGTTPTDYLITFGALALAAFNSAGDATGITVQFVSYVIVLFYGCEVIIGRIASRWHILNWSTLATLLIVASRGLFAAG
jgi:UDP-GlcNAc:undecaprenyl-phosphate GlcNAc-1-phosphate transferase